MDDLGKISDDMLFERVMFRRIDRKNYSLLIFYNLNVMKLKPFDDPMTIFYIRAFPRNEQGLSELVGMSNFASNDLRRPCVRRFVSAVNSAFGEWECLSDEDKKKRADYQPPDSAGETNSTFDWLDNSLTNASSDEQLPCR